MSASFHRNRRILIVDDNEDIHHDFRRILEPGTNTSELDEMEASLFGVAPAAAPKPPVFELTSAYQGAEALAKVCKALEEGTPYALAFIDVRMPPGWDGIETLTRLWKEDPHLLAVICSAYSDYSWEDLSARLGQTDRMLILKKPFDPGEVRQMACALIEKWNHRHASGRSGQEPPGTELLLPLTDDILLMPLIGRLDAERLQHVRETLVEGVSSQRARFAILDVTGVTDLDIEQATALVSAVQAARREGVEFILTGVRPELARALPEGGQRLAGVTTHLTLKSGVAFALGRS
jgi:anti-anti-sigma regulatory factor/DNA-binding NarL/FixJ family response regulator